MTMTEFKLGSDPVKIAPLTGQRKSAAAALPYVKFALIGTTGMVPREMGDDTGVWLMRLTVTSDVGDTLRLFKRYGDREMVCHFEAWTDAPRDEAQSIKERFDAELAKAGRGIKDGASLFDCPPDLALQGLLTLCTARGAALYDNAWYDAKVNERALANARLIGRRR